jgi:aryl-alcohol dehydrogenase-like predicted oxidoreductase
MSPRRDFLAGSAALSVAAGLVGVTENSTGSKSIMRSYRLPHTDLEVSRVALGCDRLVREGVSPDATSATDIAQASRVVNVARENGITLFDTSELYGGGTSEAALRQVLAQSRGLRHKVVIQTKCDLGRSHAAIIGSAEGSLRRLGTDYLDILLLHIQHALRS